MGKPVSSLINQSHDFIRYFTRDCNYIFNIAAPLYEKGHSLTEIAQMTGFGRTTIRNHLKKREMAMRPNKCVSATELLRRPFKSSTQSPYGYCYLDGKLEKHPKEYPILQIIEQQWKMGKLVSEIVRYLNTRGFKARIGRRWGYTSVKKVVQRFNKTN